MVTEQNPIGIQIIFTKHKYQNHAYTSQRENHQSQKHDNCLQESQLSMSN